MNFSDKLVPRELNCTELIQNQFEISTRRPRKSARSIRVRAGRVHELIRMNWTELNGGTWPWCPELNWMNFTDKLVPNELNATELMPNKFEPWTRRRYKFTTLPALHGMTHLSVLYFWKNEPKENEARYFMFHFLLEFSFSFGIFFQRNIEMAYVRSYLHPIS